MLKRGRYCWIRLNSSISASTSPDATIHSTLAAASTMASVRGWSGSGPVVRQPLPERAGLPDVDDPSVLVPEEVGAGSVRDAGRCRLGEAHPPIVAPPGDPAGNVVRLTSAASATVPASASTVPASAHDGECSGHRRGGCRTGRSSRPSIDRGDRVRDGVGPGDELSLEDRVIGRLSPSSPMAMLCWPRVQRVLVVEVDRERLRRPARRGRSGRRRCLAATMSRTVCPSSPHTSAASGGAGDRQRGRGARSAGRGSPRTCRAGGRLRPRRTRRGRPMRRPR